MKYYLIAGERSGDQHGANLMKALKKQDPAASFRFWGGDEMQAEGGELVQHYKDLAFMGILEVLKNLKTIRAFLKKCREDIQAHPPEVLILIDYAGFNLRMAKFIKKMQLDIPVYYYISPKVWAWNQGRAKKIRRLVDKMFVIFPFEVDFYQKYDFAVDFVGNPLWDSIRAFRAEPKFREKNQLDAKPIIALLPGSRQQEVSKILKVLTSIQGDFPSYQWVIAGVSNLDKEIYQPYLAESNIKIVYDQAYDLLQESEAALVTSGTATLETALLDTPQVVVYRTSFITYSLALLLIKIDFISLVNLVAKKEVVKELIQSNFNSDNLKKELQMILKGGSKRERILTEYQEMKIKLGDEGAAQNTASKMYQYLQARSKD